MYDEDIKIAGNKPSISVKENAMASKTDAILNEAEILKAESFGKRIAEEFCVASTAHSDAVEEQDENMLIQRHLLLSFTVTIGIETFLKSEAAQGVAQKSFLDLFGLPESFLRFLQNPRFSFRDLQRSFHDLSQYLLAQSRG